MKIIKASSISYQKSFDNVGFMKQLIPIDTSSVLLEPDYEDLIPAGLERRMSQVVLMACANALNCQNENDPKADGIIIATAHGCPLNTKKFLRSIHVNKGKLLSPTPFMLSTHNTIAGQISLLTNNKGYNITHTQNSLSFEHSLIDAMMLFKEGMKVILIGGCDENETEIYKHKFRLKESQLNLGEGASFFLLSDDNSIDNISIIDVEAYTFCDDREEKINSFLIKNDISHNEIDAVFFIQDNNVNKLNLDELFTQTELVNVKKYCKTYFTMSAFALHMAFSYSNIKQFSNILICNNLIDDNLGLMLLKNNL